MSNGIAERQNEESNITRLAAQRQLYRDVNRIEILNVALTVIVPIVLSIIQDPDGWSTIIACIISYLMLGFSFEIDAWQREKKILAATIQQEFDIDVFNMDWDRKLYGVHKNLNTEIARASKKIIGNEKEKEVLKNWYRKEVDLMSLEEGIAACQKENFSWDAGLRKRYRVVLVICLVLIVSVEIAIGLANNETIRDFLLRTGAVLSAIKWISKTIVGLNADLKRMESIERSVYSNEKKTMDDLGFTQKDIFESRKVVTKIPDWLYKMFKDNDEDRERRSLEMH